MKSSETIRKTTVVDFMRDAGFFVERGLRSLHRYDYEKALRCFRRAIELEPTKAEYHCHLASVLAETGQFEASNDILYEIIEKWDPAMVEVYFFMANNYANLEDYQMAEEMAIRYLESRQDTYREEAEELLDYIYFELDMPPRHILPVSENDVYSKHEMARRSLEEGRFLEALNILQNIVETDPTFMPAWNNLSLAYYYVGDFEQAMVTIEQTLEREPGNLHALCNLAVLLSHHNRAAELVTVLDMLKKVKPLHNEHIYKLATTMGVLGQHQEAYRLYQRLLKTGIPQEPCTYHYAAISAYLSNHKNQAVRWWQKVKQLDPDSGVADHYLQMVKAEEDGQTMKRLIPYQYHHPMREMTLEKGNAACGEDFKSDPMIRASLLWALQHGKDEVKHTVLQTLALIGDDEAEAAVRQFYYQTTNEQLQKLALLALAEMGAPLPSSVPDQRSPAHAAEESSVEACILQHLAGGNHQACCDWSMRVWQYYRDSGQFQQPVRKAVAWVAALEYLYGKAVNQKQTQTALAQKYGVSPATVAKCIKALAALDLNKFSLYN
ncbi:tetratricopeptide repeat protein [Brevibacillus sp. H7]|uniref:tetratricopeptide repeat protein n=1 Tax=Brevibacillus sp. H7 TaxID=3349138 RepID=UPI0037FFAD12